MLKPCGDQSLPNLAKEHTLMTTNDKNVNTLSTESITAARLELRLHKEDGSCLRQNVSINAGYLYILGSSVTTTGLETHLRKIALSEMRSASDGFSLTESTTVLRKHLLGFLSQPWHLILTMVPYNSKPDTGPSSKTPAGNLQRETTPGYCSRPTIVSTHSGLLPFARLWRRFGKLWKS